MPDFKNTFEPRALTAKFSGWRHPKTGKAFAPGPFRVVLMRDGDKYKAYITPTGQCLQSRRLPLQTTKDCAVSCFETQLEPWRECEPSKGLPV